MANRFVSLWFPYLATDWHTSKQPQLANRAFVLKATVQNRIVITAANPLAHAQGIREGMVLADALAIYPTLHTLPEKQGLTDQLLQRIAEWCIRFTPVAAPDSPAGILLDATGCAHLWGGEEAYLTAIVTRLQTKGYTACVAMAGTIGTAWAVARSDKQIRIVAPEKTVEAILPLPVSLLRLPAEMVVRLHKLGLRGVHDLVAIPRKALNRRFGPALLLRLMQALGEEAEHLVPVYPEEPYQERLPSLVPIVTRKGIERALEELLFALCNRLQQKAKGLRTAVFRAYRVEGGAQGITIGTNRATQNWEHLFQLFSLKLETLEPKEGFDLFILEATTVEEYVSAQEQLWQVTTGLQDAQLAALLDRFAGRLGENSIHRFLPAAHWWPERSFKKAANLTEQPAAGWKLDKPRPLQLLQPPAPIDVTAPVPDYPPMLFRYKGNLHKIMRADGPERIEQEWWIQDGEHRDYYCVEDEEGRRYWLFRSGHYNEQKAPGWFLHGFFA